MAGYVPVGGTDTAEIASDTETSTIRVLILIGSNGVSVAQYVSTLHTDGYF